jgi:ribosomal protein S18 acetylase RimI-like enzyme
MRYVDCLKEAAAPTNQSQMYIATVDSNSPDIKTYEADIRKLWNISTEENNKHSKFYRTNPVKIDDWSFKRWIYAMDSILLFIYNDSVIGLMGLKEDQNEGSMMIYDFVVDSDFRSRGIGSHMMKQAVDVTKKYGYNKLDLEVWANNKRAEAMYKKHGFKDAFKRMRKFV